MFMNSCEFIHFISSLACVIAQSTNEEELSILATFFTQLGDTLATISATKLNTKTCTSLNTDTNSNKCEDTYTEQNANTNTNDSNTCQF